MAYYSNIDNELQIHDLKLLIPYFGIWCAEVVISSVASLNPHITLTVGDLSLFGTPIDVKQFAGSTHALIIGGYGNWRKSISAKGYYYSAGVKLGTILTDASIEVGEKVQFESNPVIGNYNRIGGPAQYVLADMAQKTNMIWFIDNNGVTQFKSSRDSGTISSQFDIVSCNHHYAIVATETLSDWIPGKQYSNAILGETKTVNAVMMTMGKSGVLRLEVQNE